MTCVLGMVVRREREIREFVKTPFYRVTVVHGILRGKARSKAEWQCRRRFRVFPVSVSLQGEWIFA